MIVWLRLDMHGHEAAAITQQRNRWNLSGVALFVYDSQPCRLDYEIECDGNWGTRDVSVRGQVGALPVSLVLSRSADDSWCTNDLPAPALHGCVDIDLGFSPSTNLLPIRRTKLAIGEHAAVRAAWVRFPDFAVEVLDQTYARLSESTYHYESAGGQFSRDLTVDPDGFVIDYPGLWIAETADV
jgi:hypothetical protein